MSTRIHNKYKDIIRNSPQESTVQEWYLKSCVLNNTSKSSSIQHFLASLEQIKQKKEESDPINIPILSNQIFKGIFKKQSGNSSFYNSFILKQYQNDGIKLIKEYKYNSADHKYQKLEIVQLTRIYSIIDNLINDLKTLENLQPSEIDTNSLKQKLNSINVKVEEVLNLFENKENHGISLSLDKHLSIDIYLKRDSMVIRFKLKNNVTTIGYINDPFLINMYAKLMHFHDSISKIVYNVHEID